MRPDNVLDNLFINDEEQEESMMDMLSDNIVVPKRCTMCKTAVVCSVLPTFMNLSKIRLFVSIEQCPYHQPNKNAEVKKTSR